MNSSELPVIKNCMTIFLAVEAEVDLPLPRKEINLSGAAECDFIAC